MTVNENEMDMAMDISAEVKAKPAAYRTEVVICTVLMAVLFICFVLTVAFRFLVGMGIAAVWLAVSLADRRKGKQVSVSDRMKNGIVVLLLILLPNLLMSVLFIESHSLWRLPFQQGLINHYHNVKMPEDVLPSYSELKDHAESDYHFSYLASAMQGTGHFTVSFTADSGYAESLAAEFSGRCTDSFPLSDYSDSADLASTDPVIATDYDFWQGREDGAVVYLLDHSGNVNHPHSTAVIVDTQSGAVSFSRLG